MIKIDLFLCGTGEYITTIDKTSELRGYNIVCASVNLNSGRLEMSVKPVGNVSHLLRFGYKCYRDGKITKNGRLLEKGERVKISGCGDLSQAAAILMAFDPDCNDKSGDIIFLDGNKDNQALSNLRWR